MEETNEQDEDEDFRETQSNITDNLTINDRDDIYFWLKDKRICETGLMSFKFYEFPKIQLYNHKEANIDYITNEPLKNKAPKNNTANAEYIRYIILNFCQNIDGANNEELLEMMTNINKNI